MAIELYCDTAQIYRTFFFATFLIATRSPLKMPIVVKTWAGGDDVQLAIDARPEFKPICWNEKFYAENAHTHTYTGKQ